MIPTIIQFVRANELPIIYAVCVAGCIFCVVSDSVRKRNIEKPGSIKNARQLTVGLYIAGLVFMVAGILALFFGGYIGASWNRLFG